jgi:hypothetical protein
MTAQSRPIALAAAGSGVAYTGQCALRGFWLVTSAAATVTIYDGVTAAGTVLAQWTTAGANADKQLDISDGARCETGIYVQVSAGTVTGNVRIG